MSDLNKWFFYYQILQDKGFKICEKCKNINAGYFCNECGTAFFEKVSYCENCKISYNHKLKYCEECGSVLEMTEIEKNMINGTLNTEEILSKFKPLDTEFRDKILDINDQSSELREIEV